MNGRTTQVPAGVAIGAARARLVIVASSLGTVFEWFDFFIYGTLAPVIGKLFFPAGNDTAQFLFALAAFGIGFGVRPIGAAIFGHMGDRVGRKTVFLLTVTIMGCATAGVGLVPTFAQAGMAAPVMLVALRVVQGLALGGEYGGAAIYVAEHAPAARRGLYTSFIQASVIGGFLLSLGVVVAAHALIAPADWDAWGWRVPFLFSLVLLALTFVLRLRLAESPVFRAMKAAGRIARNPVGETFSTAQNIRLMMVATIGVAAGLTVIWYTAQFGALYFLEKALRVDDTIARVLVGIGALASVGWFVLFGALSDRIGRKPPIVLGYGLSLLLIFPLFHLLALGANPGMHEAVRRAPVLVSGPDCRYHPFVLGEQPTACSRIQDHLVARGVAYTKARTPGVAVVIGGRAIADHSPAALDAALLRAGWPIAKARPSVGGAILIVLAVVGLGGLSGMTYGPVAALLAELFPARIRYSSMSIAYHLGTGCFGGFLPFIGQYIVARTGDPYAGLWYTIGVVALALIVTILYLPETRGRELD